ncbi:MAG: hypothetical protein JNK48_15155 [Bryobacterales bacterium]|nr:hypothetical protein [Bryobacterales bacterium]
MKHDHVVEAFAADRADRPFHITAVPGRAGSAKDLNDLHGLHLLCELVAADSITIPELIARRLFERERFPKLWALHSAMGCVVTLKCRIRRRSWASTKNT